MTNRDRFDIKGESGGDGGGDGRRGRTGENPEKRAFLRNDREQPRKNGPGVGGDGARGQRGGGEDRAAAVWGNLNRRRFALLPA